MANNNESMERELAELREQNRRLRLEILDRKKQQAEAEETQKRQLEEQRRLKKENEDLKAELARALRSSKNSSKCPSSDIVKAKRERRKSGRKIGGQPGHKRHCREPFSDKDIDRWIRYDLTCCPDCGGPLALCRGLLPDVVQQVEVVCNPIERTAHAADWYKCQKCEKLHCPIPADVRKGGLFGPILTAWIGYLKGGCHASFSTIRKFVRDLLGVQVSRGFLAKVIAKVSAALSGPWEELRMLLPLTKILNIDETGHKENGQRMQTWCFRAREYILFKIAESRGTAVLLEMLGADFDGIIGCDYFSSYRCYMTDFGGVLQFCLAHLIRDVKFLLDLPDVATQAYGKRFLASLQELFHIIHQRGTMTAAQLQHKLEEQRRVVLWVATQGVPSSKEAQNLARRIREHGESYFRFITTPQIDPTNNLAEQAIRFVVIDRLITQGTRSENGRHWCERIWSILGTCEQQGTSACHFIRDAVQAFFTGAPAPRLLTESS